MNGLRSPSITSAPTFFERVTGCIPRNNQAANKKQSSPTSHTDTNEIDKDGAKPLLGDTDTAGGVRNSRCARFLSNVRTFFTNLWHYKLDVGLGLLGIAGGLVIIFLVDLPTVFGSEALTKGLPFFMIGAGTTKILGAFRNAYVDTCNSGHSINSHFNQYVDVAPQDDVRKDPVNKPVIDKLFEALTNPQDSSSAGPNNNLRPALSNRPPLDAPTSPPQPESDQQSQSPSVQPAPDQTTDEVH